MPRLKPGTILPTKSEDAAITAAALADPDARPLTDEEWERAKPSGRLGRPPLPATKAQVTLRLDRDVLAALKESGPGWQSRVNALLRREMLR
jgi:uncharacterized protein (DUF4415 family)